MTTESEGRKVIFITGAASGIGRATAVYFAERGWFVGCFDINTPALESLKGEIGAHSGMFHRLDVTDRAAVTGTLAAFGKASNGKLDILFNNAGIIADGLFESQSWDTIAAVVNVNLLASLSLIHAALPLLKATKGSLCLSTSSASATFGSAGRAVYSATKHAVKGLTEALSVELATHGVRASDLLPGIIETGMFPPEMKALVPKEGMWRLMSPNAIAEAVMAAYEGDKVHYYVPAELRDYDIEATLTPEKIRDRCIDGGLF